MSEASDRRNEGMHLPVSDRLMTVEEVADFLGVPVATLYQWRHKGTGPVAFRVGRFLRYDPAEVRLWLHEHVGLAHGAR